VFVLLTKSLGEIRKADTSRGGVSLHELRVRIFPQMSLHVAIVCFTDKTTMVWLRLGGSLK